MLPSNLLTTGLQALAALSVFNVTGKDVHGNIPEIVKNSNLKNHKTAEEIYGKSAAVPVTLTAPETATVPSQGIKTTTEGFRPSDRLLTNTVQEKDRYELYGTILLPKQLQKKIHFRAPRRYRRKSVSSERRRGGRRYRPADSNGRNVVDMPFSASERKYYGCFFAL